VGIGRSLAGVLGVVALAPCWGCGLVPHTFGKIRHPAPVVRARAIGLEAGRPDSQVVPALVGRLDDADPVVRLAAHEELRRRTGRDFGFVPWASGAERGGAIARWRSWLLGRSRSPSAAPARSPRRAPPPGGFLPTPPDRPGAPPVP
jgi:hypothetical protein